MRDLKFKMLVTTTSKSSMSHSFNVEATSTNCCCIKVQYVISFIKLMTLKEVAIT